MIKVLIVEDDRDLNLSVCSFLAQNGYEATGCLNANEAYDVLYHTMFDLIISDIMMPEIDGFEFAKTVRTLNNEIPILFMMAKDDIVSKQRGYRVGIDDYMVKPVDFAELLLRVGALLRRYRISTSHRLEIGAVALGGISVYLPINILLMAVSLLFGAGGAPQAAIAMGAGNRKKAERFLGCCVLPILASGIFFSLVLFFGCEGILPLFGATETNLRYSVEYIRIICLGVPFSMLIIGLNVFINAQGRTFIGMVSVVIGAFINVVLDAIFVLALDMGVAGAAWATVIGQIVSAAWVIGFLASRHSAIRIRRKNLIPNVKLLGSITSLGVSSAITTGAESLVNIILNGSLKKYGALALTGYAVDGATLAMSAGTIITSTSSFIRLPINGFSQGLQPVISYNYGGGRTDRVNAAIRFAIIVTTAYAAVLWIILMVTPGTFTRLFTDNADVVAVSENLIRVYIFGMILSGIQSTMVQAFSARGMRQHSLMISLLCKGLYVPLLLILPLLVPAQYGLIAIYAAQPVTDVAATLISFGLYQRTETPNAA